ncbi:MAG: DUF2341 domain-containing protein [Candidatus Shapirobacteria bacterium]|jgi:parallel beta-helix repeat protein
MKIFSPLPKLKKTLSLFLLTGLVFFSFLSTPTLLAQDAAPAISVDPAVSISPPSPESYSDSPEANNSARLRPSFKLETYDTNPVFSKSKPEFKLVSGTKFKPRIKVYNNSKQEIDIELVEKVDKGDVVYSFNQATEIPPGKYTITFQDDLGGEISKDFYWGVLAINFNKSVYNPLENGYISLAVLDETGDMVCDAKLALIVEEPDGSVEELTTDDGRIKVNPECQVHGFTEKPDYETEYAFSENPGTYKFHLVAETKNGSYSITDQVQVAENLPIEVDRVMATRIYPPHPYTATINLKANEDFIGIVTETVPSSFIITKAANTEILPYKTIVEDKNSKTKKITWNLDLKPGEDVTIGYRYDIPDISPEFYLVGPIKFTDYSGTVDFFTETRQWQLAADAVAPVKIRQEINIINGLVTAAGVDAAIVNLDTAKYNSATYYFEVIAKVSAGTLTVNLSTGNTNTVGIGISDTSFVRVRSAFTPESGSFDYRLNLVNGTSPQVKAARIIILQSATTITATQTQIEIGNLEIGLSMATTAPLTSPKYWKYDSALWDGTKTFDISVSYKAGVGVTAGSQTFTVAGINTFTPPGGITSVKVECWGGGGAGGSSNTTTDGCGGGGGGAYSNKLNVGVTAGIGYTAFVGVGGTYRSQAKGGDGAASYFRNSVGVTVVSAAGGIGGTSQASSNPGAGGAGGNSTVGVGDTKWSGGTGGRGYNASAGQGGPGGSSAGIGTTGRSGPDPWSTRVASAGPTGSGIGGSGGPAGNSGAAPASGNGGGGGGSGDVATSVGGNGAGGKVVVTWAAIDNAVSIYLQEDNGSFAGWTNVVTVLSGGTATVPTSVGITNFTPTTGRNYRLVANTGLSPFDIYNAKIIVNQTSATTIDKLVPQYLLLNTKSTTTGSALGYQSLWTTDEWGRTTNTYLHAFDSIGGGTTATVKLVDIDAGNAELTNSAIGGTNQVISNGITMPTSGHQIDTWLTAAGTEVDASRILVQVDVTAVQNPTVVLNSLDNGATTTDTTPTLDFTGTSAYGDSVRYNIQIATNDLFSSSIITQTSVLSQGTETDASSYDTASISPGANKLVLLAVASRVAGGGNNTPTASGVGMSWDLVTTVQEPGSWNRISLLRAMSPSPSSGAITISFGGQTQTAVNWQISEFSNVDTSGTNGASAIGQSQTNTGASVTSLTVTLGAFQSTNNATYGAMISEVASPINQGTGFTEVYDLSVTDSALETEWKDSNDTSVDWSFTQGRVGGIAVEIKAAPSALDKVSGTDVGFSGSPDNTDPFTSAQAVNYTVEEGDSLAVGTYYWRVRGIDPDGSNAYGSWSDTRNFVVSMAANVTISGNIYTTETATAYNCSSTNLTVRAIVEGAGVGTTGICTSGGGAFLIQNITVGDTGHVITLYLDGESEKATSITKVASTSIGFTLPLYQNRVYLSHQNDGPITNADIDKYDSANDADIQYTSNGVGLTVTPGSKIVIALGKTYTPGGSIDTPSIGIGGTFNPESNTVNLTGSGSSITCTDAPGTVMPLCNSGTFNQSTSTINYNGTSASAIAALTFNNLGVGISSEAGVGTTYTFTGNVTVGGIFSIGNILSSNIDVVNASSHTLTLTQADTPLNATPKGALAPGSSTVVYTASADTSVATVDYYNLSLAPASGTPTYTLLNVWEYRRPIAITNASGGDLTDFQVSFTLDTTDSTRFQPDCDDIRITDSSGITILPHWIEENNPGCGNASTKIWTKVPSIPTAGTTIYVYYGNPIASSSQNGTSVFEFFDDFSGDSLDTQKWTKVNGSTPVLASGTLAITATADPGKLIASAGPNGDNYILKARFMVTGGSADDERLGLSVKTNTSSGAGYNLVFRGFTNLSTVQFLHDAVEWGSADTVNWAKDTYYTEEIYHDGTNVKGRFNDGSWYSWPRSGISGYLAINFASFNGTTSIWDYAVIRKAASTEPSSSVQAEQGVTNTDILTVHNDFSTSGAGTVTVNVETNNSATLDINGDFTLASGDTFLAPPTTSIAGGYTNNGTFTANSGKVTFDGTGSNTLSGYMNVGSGSTSPFYKVVFSGIGGSWTIADPIKIGATNATDTLLINAGVVTLGNGNGDDMEVDGKMNIGSTVGLAIFQTMDGLAQGSVINLDINSNTAPFNCTNCLVQVGTADNTAPQGTFVINENTNLRLNSFSSIQSGLDIYASGKITIRGLQSDTGADSGTDTTSAATRESKVCVVKPGWENDSHNNKNLRITSGLAFGKIYTISDTITNDSDCASDTDESLTINDTSVPSGASTAVVSSITTVLSQRWVCSNATTYISADNKEIGRYLHDLSGVTGYYKIVDSTNNDATNCSGNDRFRIMADPAAEFASLQTSDTFKIVDGIRSDDTFEIIDYASITAQNGVACNSSFNGYILGRNRSEVDIQYSDICNMGASDEYKTGIMLGYSSAGTDGSLQNEGFAISKSRIRNGHNGIVFYYADNNSGAKGISDNYISGHASFGIDFYYGADNNSVTSNTVCGNFQNIYFRNNSNNNTVSSNIICEATTFAGIVLYDSLSGNIVSSNTIYNNAQHGIYTGTNAIDNTFSSNTVFGNQLSGITLDSAHMTKVSGNTVNNSQYHGIYIIGGSKGNIISSNNVFGQDAGIYLYNSANNNLLYTNNSYNNAYGLQSGSNSTNNVFFGNDYYSNTSYGSYNNDGFSNNVFYNDSFYGNIFGWIDNGASNLNNILINNSFGVGTENGFYDIYQIGSAPHSTHLYSSTVNSTVEADGIIYPGSSIISRSHDGVAGATKIWGEYSTSSNNSETPQDEGLERYNYADSSWPDSITDPGFSGIGTSDTDLNLGFAGGTLGGGTSAAFVYRVYCTVTNCVTSPNSWGVERDGIGLGTSASSGVGYTDPGTNISFKIDDSGTDFALGDTYTFVAFRGSTDTNTQKTITMAQDGDLINVGAGTTLRAIGVGGSHTLITRGGSGGYHINVAGTLDASYYTLSYLGGTDGNLGLDLQSGSLITNLANGVFDNFQDVGSSDTYIRVHSDLIGVGSPTKTFSDLTFTQNGSGAPEFTVTESGGSSPADDRYWQFENSVCSSWASCEDSDLEQNTNSGGSIRWDAIIPTSPILDQLMRHGQWFFGGLKQPFTF